MTARKPLVFPGLRITSKSPRGRHVKLELAGQDISQWCRKVVLKAQADDVITAAISLYIGEVDIDVASAIEVELDSPLAAILEHAGWTPPIIDAEVVPDGDPAAIEARPADSVPAAGHVYPTDRA